VLDALNKQNFKTPACFFLTGKSLNFVGMHHQFQLVDVANLQAIHGQIHKSCSCTETEITLSMPFFTMLLPSNTTQDKNLHTALLCNHVWPHGTTQDSKCATTF
jgi:hypothetical protein